MLSWALIFLVIALVAWVLGLPSVSVLSAEISKILLILFLILFLVGLIMGSGLFVGTPVAPPV